MESKIKPNIPQFTKCKKLSKSKCCKNIKLVKKEEIKEDAVTEVKLKEINETLLPNIVSEGGEEIEYRTLEEINVLNNSSQIQQDLKVPCNKTIYITKKEKECLEEIKSLLSKIRLPTDDRQMHFFNRDVDKFTTTVSLLEKDVPQKDLNEAAKAIEESPSNIVVTDLNDIAIYLNELKTLIAKREIAWASATENSYSQKLEIFHLKNKVDHLKTICTKRQKEIAEKDKLLENKDTEITKLKKFIERLKFEIIQLGKNRDNENLCAGLKGRQLKDDNRKLMNDLVTDDLGKLEGKSNTLATGQDVRRNHGPAALLANALYKARNRGDFVNL